jgi:hypothetical protein
MSYRLNQDGERDMMVQVAVDKCHVLLIICNAGKGGFTDTVCPTIYPEPVFTRTHLSSHGLVAGKGVAAQMAASDKSPAGLCGLQQS